MSRCRDAGDGELGEEHSGDSFSVASPLKILNLEIINAIFAI
jgi:hypothetical protein